MSNKKQLWTEKYRPKKVDDLIQHDELINILNNVKQTKKMQHMIFHGNPGTGKCLDPDTEVILYDGQIKKAKDIIINDKLMGDDGKERNVLSIIDGNDIMYKIIQEYGDDYVVNSSHILSLVLTKEFIEKENKLYWFENHLLKINKFSDNLEMMEFKKKINNNKCGEKLDINVEQYLNMETEWKEAYKGYKINKIENWNNIINTQNDISFKYGNWIKKHQYDYKYIHNAYKLGSFDVRKDFLTGFLDYISNDVDYYCSTILFQDIKFMIRSIGYIIYDIFSIDKKYKFKIKNNVPYDIKIEKIGSGKYCGFEIDNNKRFLLGDFTVTHNTSSILAICNELFPKEVYSDRVLELNASDERGIGIVRDVIATFVKTSIDMESDIPPFKIVILDEADAMTMEAQSALRKIIESVSGNTRFCFLCNYINQIIEPIISRCLKIRFRSIDNNNMITRLKLIIKNENEEIEDNIIKTIAELSKGDIRKGITILQNSKSLKKIKNKISEDDIYNLVGYIPDIYIFNIWNKCFDENILISHIMQDIYAISKQGYIIKSAFYQLKNLVLNNKILSSKKKSLIFIHLSNIERRLYEGANEFIQLLSIFSYLIDIIKDKEDKELIYRNI